MTLNITCEIVPGFRFHYKELARRVIEKSLEMEGFPYETEVSLTLTGNEQIHEINLQTRQIDRPTDVLSFPMLEQDFPGDFEGIEDQWEDVVNPDTDEIMLGDIVISAEKVREQAEAYGHSEKREYAFLITHSMLHLMGYDHMEPEDASLMEEHQRMILRALDINR